jgi:molybdopterin molybdotransferase
MAQTIELERAEALVLEHARVCGDEEVVPLLESLGRRLARDLRCDEPWPTTDRSAMDGFALAHGAPGPAAAGSAFALVGAALAGHPFDRVLAPGEAVRIMTGGVVPAGADRVAKVEDTEGFVDGATRVRLTAAVEGGANIRPIGSEIAAGATVLRAGARLRSAEIAALAVLGHAEVPVVRRPRVAILSTGDEVVEIGARPAPHQVRDSNSWALAAKVIEAGGEALRLGIAGDEPDALRAALRRGLEADVLVTIGGVSKGTHDLVHGSLAALGVRTIFHGVTLKPGKPTFFGIAELPGRSCQVFGLPGNPASAATTFDLFVWPALCRFGGGAGPAMRRASLGGVRCRRDRRSQAIPARLVDDGAGRAVAELTALRPSGDPFALVGAEGYGIVPADTEPAELGTIRFVACAGGPEAGPA